MRNNFHKIKAKKNPSEEGLLLIWQRPTFPGFTQVSSARGGLTSLFEKGRGEHPWYSHHKIFKVPYNLTLVKKNWQKLEVNKKNVKSSGN